MPDPTDYLDQPDPATAAQAQRDAVEQMREQLAALSAGDLVAETAVPLVTLAYMRLGVPPGQNDRYRDLEAASLLIDALAGMLDGVQGRLGAVEPELRRALADLQLGYAEVVRHSGGHAGAGASRPGPRDAGPGGTGPGAQPSPRPSREPAAPPPGAGPAQPGRRPSGLWVPGQP
ncbi:MAG TPA: hypothetical protein VG276_21070 [Actinomycetes bacterium]|jgi:hypothetical protein|nr:hypothetical protein [Actinomycetes bacterium]